MLLSSFALCAVWILVTFHILLHEHILSSQQKKQQRPWATGTPVCVSYLFLCLICTHILQQGFLGALSNAGSVLRVRWSYTRDQVALADWHRRWQGRDGLSSGQMNK